MKIKNKFFTEFSTIDLGREVLTIPPNSLITEIYHTDLSTEPITYYMLIPSIYLINELESYHKKCLDKLGLGYMKNYTIYNFISITSSKVALKEELNLENSENINEPDNERFIYWYSKRYEIGTDTNLYLIKNMLTTLAKYDIILEYVLYQKTHRITDLANSPRLLDMKHYYKRFNIKEA